MISSRRRNDNVSGRVPPAAGAPLPQALADGAVEIANLVRARKWDEARALLAALEAEARR